MSEWVSVLAVFWVLWALDGVRLVPRRIFTVIGGAGLKGARIVYSRLSRPGLSPASWRMAVSDVPLSLSPTGVCNRPVGSAGRPVEHPTLARAWRWEQVREVGVSRGWIFVNGEAFCPDTKHVSAPQLLELSQLEPATRENKIHSLLQHWFRPANLRRRVRVLVARSAAVARLNAITAVVLVVLTAYIIADVPSRIPEWWSEVLADALPWVLLGLLLTHFTAFVLAWRDLRWLMPVMPEKRMSSLFGALLLPPQALRLRALLSDGFFPPQHPFTAVLAFGDRVEAEQFAFHTLADLRWPVGGAGDPALANDIGAWFRLALETRLLSSLDAVKISSAALLAPPAPDARSSCSYCPRCRDQFVTGPTECPLRVPLLPLQTNAPSQDTTV